MKKTLTTITFATVLALSSTFAYADAGIIVAGSPMAEPATCTVDQNGIIVAGKAIIGSLFGIIVAGSPIAGQCTADTEGIIVAG